MSPWDWHDRIFLWWLQEVLYAHPTLAACAWCAVLLGLPSHRWLSNAIRWCFLAAALICLARYNALGEAPFLAYSLLAAMSYLFVRWLLWRLPMHVAAKQLPRGLGWLRPRMAWTGVLVRDYFRVDPRGTYWLDLARAVRGFPVLRTAADRRDSVAAADYLSGWRKTCWQLVFWLVEARIQVYRRLPTYWHDPRRSATSAGPRRPLELDEPYPRTILEAEQQVAYRKMLECWTGRNLADYCRRDAVARQEAARQAASWGRKNMLHREALAECSIYRTPWMPKERALIQAAWRMVANWRHRRQYDFLWDPEMPAISEMPEPSFVNGTPAESLADNVHANSAALAFEEVALASSSINASGPEPVAETGVGTEPVPLTAADDSEQPGTDGEEQSAASEEPTGDGDEPVAEAAEGERSSPEDPNDEDDELFRILAATESSAGQTSVAGPAFGPLPELTDRDRIRLEDLRLASRLLEAYLGVTPRGEFDRDVECVEPFLDQSKHVTAAAMLLLLYCLRRDYAGRETDRRKVDLIVRLTDRFQQAPENSPYREAQQVVRSLQFDWLADRADYSQLVAGLDTYSNLSVYEWKLLANAEATLAQQLSGQPELRDVLRHDAIDHYFQAGFRGLWTLTYARAVLGPLAGIEDLVELLRTHSVEVTPSTSLTVADVVQHKTQPTAKPGKPAKPTEPPPIRRRFGKARNR